LVEKCPVYRYEVHQNLCRTKSNMNRKEKVGNDKYYTAEKITAKKVRKRAI